MKNVDDDIDAALAVEMASLKGNHDDYYDDNDNTNEGIMNSRTANKYQNTNDANPNIAQVCGSNLAALVRAYLTYIRVHQPGMFWTIACLLLLVPTTLLILDLVDNPLEEFGVIAHDYSTINLQSNFDHTMKDIDHWCLKGDNDSCRCEDPTLPAPRNEFRRWSNAHAGNVAMIEDLLTQGVSEPDIAFLGGTVVEKMDGRWFGDISLPGLNQVADIFTTHFGGGNDDDDGTEDTLTAAALGIAADLNQSVLWRIMNGEMPETFHPKIWWLELGLNDLGRAQCSEEVVIIGVLRIVEEIQKRQPDAMIVINSLFPMADLRGGVANAVPTTPIELQKSYGGPPPKGGWNKAQQQYQKQQQQQQQQTVMRPRPGGTAGMPPNIAAIQNKPKIKNYRPRSFQHQLPPRAGGGIPPNRNGVPRAGGPPPPQQKRYYDNGNNRRERERQLRHADRGFRDPNSNGNPGVGGGTNFRRDRTPGSAGLFQRNRNPNHVRLGRDPPQGGKQQHQFNPITRQEHKLPLWTSIVAINLELRKFCNKHDNVYFFDVTKMFTEKDGYNYNLKTSMINRVGVPTNAGFEKWETAVANQAKFLLGRDKK